MKVRTFDEISQKTEHQINLSELLTSVEFESREVPLNKKIQELESQLEQLNKELQTYRIDIKVHSHDTTFMTLSGARWTHNQTESRNCQRNFICQSHWWSKSNTLWFIYVGSAPPPPPGPGENSGSAPPPPPPPGSEGDFGGAPPPPPPPGGTNLCSFFTPQVNLEAHLLHHPLVWDHHLLLVLPKK